ncbi:mucin-5AC-like [Diaphorina citri]|uniref:Mucin-5AC-like n=1 Tax=Diaphorina citri TaxID=121845 RepID=A0A3Q0JDF7_DIACI|nr:mucin-5AC-like [Diaphorina citri]
MIENSSEYDKSVFETTVAVSGTTSGITPFDPTERTEQPVETTSITDGTSHSEDRIFDPAEKSGFTHKNQEGTSASTFVTSDIKELPTSTSETISGHLETTIETEEKQLFTAVTTTLEYPDVNTDLKQVPDSTTTYTIISDNNVITTEENEMRKLMTTMVTSNNNFDSTTHFEVLTSVVPTANVSPTSEPESDLRNLISTTSGTLDKDGFTTVTDARYLDTTTFRNNIASTNDGSPDDLRQIPTSTTDNYVFSTTKSLPDTTTEAPETTTEALNIENSSDDLRRILPTTTEDTVSTTQNSLEHDLRKIATTTTETYDATPPSTTDSLTILLLRMTALQTI